jgi:hypothetical protein
MKQEVKIGQADYTVLILIRDSTTGAPKTGLTNASAGIDVGYTRVETDNDVTWTDGAVVALATPALTDPHLDWGFLEVDAAKAPGIYRLDIADGVFASGAWSAAVSLIATGIDPVHIEFTLVPESPYAGVALSATGADLILKTSTFIQAIVAAINEFATYGLTALNTLLVTTGIKATSVPNVTLANGAHGGVAATLTLSGAAGLVATKIDAPINGAITGNITGNLSGTTGGHAVGVDFTAVEKTSLNAATPASVQNIPVDGTLKVDTVKVNSTALDGDGSAGDPWGPA